MWVPAKGWSVSGLTVIMIIATFCFTIIVCSFNIAHPQLTTLEAILAALNGQFLLCIFIITVKRRALPCSHALMLQ